MNNQPTIYMTQYTQDKFCGGNYFAGLLLVFLSYFVPPSLDSEREVDCTHFGFVMASLGCSEHTSLLLF